jgi:hypothetical protein
MQANMKSTLTLTADLAQELGLSAGDEFEICVKGKVTSSDANGLTGEVTSAENDEDEDAEEQSGMSESTADEETPAPTKRGGKVSQADKLLQSEQE